MYFHKIEHPYNFAPMATLESSYIPVMTVIAQDTFRLKVQHPDWQDLCGYVKLQELQEEVRTHRFSLDWDPRSAMLSVIDSTTGMAILNSHPDMPFGVCGKKWLFSFLLEEGTRFYGMGEKNIGFEKSAKRTKFWNTDVWADFATDEINNGATDPMYASMPILLVKRDDSWVGMMIPSPAAVFMDTGARQVIEGVKDNGTKKSFFYLGAPEGMADLIITMGTCAQEVVTRLSKLVGLPEKPPLWALGYHQSRWGYGSLADAKMIDERMLQHDIACDAIWFDIDYMDGYRIFTIREEAFAQQHAVMDELHAHGRKLVPILDPGIKVDHEYTVCQEGLQQDVFCHNPQGKPYVGFVWPGASHFPDFSLSQTIQWWADHTAELAKKGFDAFWIDMNDPSTGSCEVQEMLFGKGTIKHETLHNHYALGMAEATWQGLKQAFPQRRPFLVTRSAMLGSSRYGALWTGDNIANYHHLRKSIEMALSLSLSGMAYVGNDIGGFGGDTNDELITDWYRACLLFPFFRNHSADGTHRQEPWAFSQETLDAIREAIHIRYVFLPYLYNLFIDLSRTGVPIIRPMVYESNTIAYEWLDTQFMIGEALLQAPKLYEGQTEREVMFPEKSTWIGLFDGTEYIGGQQHSLDLVKVPIPLFLRSGSIIPLSMKREHIMSTQDIDLAEPAFLLYLGDSTQGQYEYVYDSGEGYGREHTVSLSYTKHASIIDFTICADKSIACTISLIQEFSAIRVNGKTIALMNQQNSIPGMNIEVWTSEKIRIS